jgi:hypothetical protein
MVSEDVTESEDDSSHLYLGDMWDDERVRREDSRVRREDERVRREDERVRREEEAQQLDEEHRELSDEEQHRLWEEQQLRREAEFMRTEEEAFERAEQELLRIRGERRRYAELERQREQIEIQNDLIESLYEYQQGEPVDENYYDNENDQQNGEAPSIEYISEQLVARGVTIDNLVSATLRTNSAYYRSTAEHDRINAVITKHISEIVFEYILRPQLTPQKENAGATELSNDWWEPEE